MATRTGITTPVANRLVDSHQSLFIAAKAEFDTDDIRVWTGNDDLTIDSETYLGAGSLLTISEVTEGREVKSEGISIALSGMDKTVLSYALTENYQNRPITLFLGFLMGGSNEVAGTITLFKGRMVNLTVNDSPQGSIINVDAENRLVDLERPSNLRYTAESQEFLFSGDTGFNRMQQLIDKQVTWGQETDNTTNRTTSEDTNTGEFNIRI
tara:strand:- start:2607 stop:3239 length:633 start_codon:yes stop_codon:yes gene_type:complete